MIDWLKRVSLEFCHRNEKKHSTKERWSEHQYGILLSDIHKQTGPSAHISAQILFSVASRLRHRILFCAIQRLFIDAYSKRRMYIVHLCFQRATNGLRCNKNWSKQKRQHFNHTHAYTVASFRQFFTIIYFYLFFARLFFYLNRFFFVVASTFYLSNNIDGLRAIRAYEVSNN